MSASVKRQGCLYPSPRILWRAWCWEPERCWTTSSCSDEWPSSNRAPGYPLPSGRLSQAQSAQKRLYLSLNLGTVLENANYLIEALQVRHQHLRHYLRIE